MRIVIFGSTPWCSQIWNCWIVLSCSSKIWTPNFGGDESAEDLALKINTDFHWSLGMWQMLERFTWDLCGFGVTSVCLFPNGALLVKLLTPRVKHATWKNKSECHSLPDICRFYATKFWHLESLCQKVHKFAKNSISSKGLLKVPLPFGELWPTTFFGPKKRNCLGSIVVFIHFEKVSLVHFLNSCAVVAFPLSLF